VHCKLRHAMQIETEALRLAAINPQKRPIGSLRVSGTLSLRPDCLAGAKDTNLHMVGPRRITSATPRSLVAATAAMARDGKT
jgi:hypothetical protein